MTACRIPSRWARPTEGETGRHEMLEETERDTLLHVCIYDSQHARTEATHRALGSAKEMKESKSMEKNYTIFRSEQQTQSNQQTTTTTTASEKKKKRKNPSSAREWTQRKPMQKLKTENSRARALTTTTAQLLRECRTKKNQERSLNCSLWLALLLLFFVSFFFSRFSFSNFNEQKRRRRGKKEKSWRVLFLPFRLQLISVCVCVPSFVSASFHSFTRGSQLAGLRCDATENTLFHSAAFSLKNHFFVVLFRCSSNKFIDDIICERDETMQTERKRNVFFRCSSWLMLWSRPAHRECVCPKLPTGSVKNATKFSVVSTKNSTQRIVLRLDSIC